MKYTIALAALLMVSAPSRGQQAGTYHDQRVSIFEQLPIGKKDIVFLGNSITDFNEWHEFFDNKRVKNRGISGNTTWDVLSRLGQVTAGEPKKVFLMIGVNDLGMGSPVDTVMENIVQIIERIGVESPRTKLYVQSILPVNNQTGPANGLRNRSGDILQLNAMVQKYCNEKGIPYIDLHTALMDERGMLSSEYSNDGLHLMGEGYVIWKNVLTPYMK